MKQIKKIVLLVFFSSLVFLCHAQEKVENINSALKNNKIVITYDLVNVKFNQVVFITVFYSTDNGKTFTGPLKEVTGDVGTGIAKGTDKKITWDPIMEQVFFSASDQVVFRVQAEIETQEIKRKFYVSYLGNINTPFGISLGLLGKTGFYINVRTNQHLTEAWGYDYSNIKMEYPTDGFYTFTGNYTFVEYAASTGVNFQLSPNIFLYAGGGYFEKVVLWEIENRWYNESITGSSTGWVNYDEKSRNGAFAETGLTFKVTKRLILSAGTIYDLKYINWTAGLGICF